METIKFASNNEFRKTLKKRVGDYFKENNISKYGNANMIIKTIFMLSVFYVPFVLYCVGTFEGVGMNLLLWVIIGLGMSGIGLSIMHDAIHGSYSKKKWVNTALGYTLNLMGGHSLNWEVQHNVLHHSFTNIEGYDEDIEKELGESPFAFDDDDDGEVITGFDQDDNDDFELPFDLPVEKPSNAKLYVALGVLIIAGACILSLYFLPNNS